MNITKTESGKELTKFIISYALINYFTTLYLVGIK